MFHISFRISTVEDVFGNVFEYVFWLFSIVWNMFHLSFHSFHTNHLNCAPPRLTHTIVDILHIRGATVNLGSNHQRMSPILPSRANLYFYLRRHDIPTFRCTAPAAISFQVYYNLCRFRREPEKLVIQERCARLRIFFQDCEKNDKNDDDTVTATQIRMPTWWWWAVMRTDLLTMTMIMRTGDMNDNDAPNFVQRL